jgi:hypothetical protein
MSILQARFKGQAALEAQSYTSQMAKLGIKAEEASEIIGKGLVDALKILGGSNDIKELTDDIDRAATSTAKLIVEMAKLGQEIKSSFDLPANLLTEFVRKTQPLVDLIVEGDPSGFMKKPRASARRFFTGGSTGPTANDRAAARAEAEALKRQKELIALQKKSAIAEKNKLSLSKAAAVFDSTRISLAAALQATYDKETRLRLEALQAIEEDNGTLAIKKINELAALQKNADLAKLAGITTVSEAYLSSLNTQLLTELQVINKTKMAEGDKELRREEAFKKYNAAIVAAGELAASESYSERTNIQLVEIAKLASLSKTSSAANTLALLRESVELNVISTIAEAQKKADEARYKALQEYMRLLASAGGGKIAPPTVEERITEIQRLTDRIQNKIGGPASLPGRIEEIERLTERIQNKINNQNSYNININAGVIAREDELAQLVQKSIQDLNRAGDPLVTAGALP